MLSPKYQRFADRVSELIEEGQEVAKLERPFRSSSYIGGEDKIQLHTWLVNVENIITSVFGVDSAHYRHFQQLAPHGIKLVEHSSEVLPIVGLLSGALDDLKHGFLLGQEYLVAAEVLDTVLEQASELNAKGYKDPAAVLARVALEDALKRLARAEGINDNQKASAINTDLWKAGTYSKPMWRQVQAWLDIGNAAAHGDFDKYSQDDVIRLIDGVELFLATEFQP